jgi:hypothetical protein
MYGDLIRKRKEKKRKENPSEGDENQPCSFVVKFNILWNLEVKVIDDP